jgi:hypothetical protein
MDRLLLLGHVRLETNRRYSSLDESFIEKFRAATEPQIISDAVN